MITIERKVSLQRGRRGRKQLTEGEPGASTATGRVSHVTRLMALAIRLDRLIRDGVVTDQAELARLGHVSRARLTQIMNLLSLTPDIQEQILFLPPTERGRDVVAEKQLRPIAGVLDWRTQRRLWAHRSVAASPKSMLK